MPRRKKGPSTILSALDEQPVKAAASASSISTASTAPAEPVAEAAPTPVVEEKTAPEEKKSEAKEAASIHVHIQSLMGGDIELDTIINRVREAAPTSKDLTIYVKAEANKAYFTSEDQDGSIDLW